MTRYTVFRGRAALLFALFVFPLIAQQPPRPRVFAIEGARIVTVSGAEIPSGTVLVRDGLIEAVGPSVAAPADAWVIDGEGMTVYPGFIDAMSSLGMSAPKREGEAPLSAGPQDRPSTMPWVRAADTFSPEQDDVAAWRASGFTTVAATPEGGFFPGNVSLINLSDAGNSKRVVEPKAAVVVAYPDETPGHRAYPGALLGYIAYVKQLYIDTRYAMEAERMYADDPTGLERPGYDPSTEALAESLEGGRRTLYPADTVVQLHRARNMVEHTTEALGVYGAQEAYDEPGALGGLPALVDVSWPKEQRDPDPDREVTLRTLRLRYYAPTTPAKLAESGALFAFYASDAKKPGDFLEGVGKAIGRGLSPADAVEALTLGAAKFYNVDDRLGSIDEGKIANLVVFKDDPFTKGARAEMVFVDGVKYDILPEPASKREPKEQTR